MGRHEFAGLRLGKFFGCTLWRGPSAKARTDNESTVISRNRSGGYRCRRRRGRRRTKSVPDSRYPPAPVGSESLSLAVVGKSAQAQKKLSAEGLRGGHQGPGFHRIRK